MNKLVSILIPVYNVEKFIGKCAKTLLEQTYDNIEYIFVNDCTKDNSIDVLNQIVDTYPNRKHQVVIINHDYNKGLSAARNTALDNSHGEYILPFDSDDYISSPNAISILMKKAVSENADAVFYDLQHIFRNKTVVTKSKIPSDGKTLARQVIRRDLLSNLCGGLYKKSLFVENDIRSIDGISMGEDYVVKARISYFLKKIVYVPEPFYCYVHTNQSSITKYFKSSTIDDLLHCHEVIYSFYKNKPDGEYYIQDLRIASIRNMLSLLLSWSCYGHNNDDFNRLRHELSKIHFNPSSINIKERLIYYLTRYNFKRILILYCRLGLIIKNCFK